MLVSIATVPEALVPLVMTLVTLQTDGVVVLIVYVPAEFVQTPPLEYVTANPELAPATIVKTLPSVAVGGNQW